MHSTATLNLRSPHNGSVVYAGITEPIYLAAEGTWRFYHNGPLRCTDGGDGNTINHESPLHCLWALVNYVDALAVDA